jgi:hypothetical protein
VKLKSKVAAGVAGAAIIAGLGIGSATAAFAAPAPAPATGAPAAEQPGTEAPEAPEAPGTPSDGPGGHADTPGNVDHQFNGQE